MALVRALRAAAFLMAMLAIATLPRASLASEVKDSAKKGKAETGMYFIVPEKGPKRCFVVSMSRNTKFHVHYDFPGAEENGQVELELRLLPDNSSPEERFSIVPTQKETITKPKGSIQFRTTQAGQHSLCAVQKRAADKGDMRLSLDFDAGIRDEGYEEVQKALSLDGVQISMVKLRDRARMMTLDADYMQELEKEHHKEVIHLNRKVMWWPILQVVILLATGYYQLRHLKGFFHAKRLV